MKKARKPIQPKRRYQLPIERWNDFSLFVGTGLSCPNGFLGRKIKTSLSFMEL
jgi:hypothetical protein